jgi:Protein of unknown function (DUF1523)
LHYVKWTLRILAVPFLILALLFTHYTLPSRDVVRIVGTDVKRMDIGTTSWFWAEPDAGTNQSSTRDVRFINAVWPDGSPRVYRNEDTNWNWPPYLKFDSGNLVAQSQALAQETDVWVAVTHYGWRVELLSIFPNVVKIKRVAGPDAFLIPWFNIVFLLFIALIVYLVWSVWRKFKAKNVDPVLEDIDEAMDNVMDDVERGAADAQARAEDARKGIKGWFKRWFG